MFVYIFDPWKFIKYPITSQIIEILDSNIWIETSDGFSMKFQLKDLVKIEKETEPLLIVEKETIAEALQEKEHFRKNRKRTFSKKKEKQAPPMEVDLHIEKLVPYLKGLSNHDILTKQIDTARGQLEFAIRKRIQKIVRATNIVNQRITHVLDHFRRNGLRNSAKNSKPIH